MQYLKTQKDMHFIIPVFPMILMFLQFPGEGCNVHQTGQFHLPFYKDQPTAKWTTYFQYTSVTSYLFHSVEMINHSLSFGHLILIFSKYLLFERLLFASYFLCCTLNACVLMYSHKVLALGKAQETTQNQLTPQCY